jgi:nanoRNase/pAp phosphatase (c-di-AMP/oligoRNAs hydrolase)
MSTDRSKRIVDVFHKKKLFSLTGHEQPDGDTVGSELALAGFLKQRGKKVTMANIGPVPGLFLFCRGSVHSVCPADPRAVRCGRRV